MSMIYDILDVGITDILWENILLIGLRNISGL